jgi:hypothetical protein
VKGERKAVFEDCKREKQGTRRESGDSHLVNGERKEVFVLRIVRRRNRRTRKISGKSKLNVRSS